MQQKSVQSRGTGSIEIVEIHHMKFTPIDRTTWERNSHYDYYTNLLKCGYSVTVSLDITKLHQQVKEKGLKFYPAFVYCVSKQIAVTKEFRMGQGRKSGILRYPSSELYDLP